MPAKSAKNHPIGIDIQIPVTPTPAIFVNPYANATLIPKEITVKITDTTGLLTARKYP